MTGVIRVETAQFEVASGNLRNIADEITAAHGRLAPESWVPANSEHTPVSAIINAAAIEATLAVGALSGIAGLAGMVSDHLRQAQSWYESVDATIVQCVAAISDSAIAMAAQGIRTIAAVGIGAVVGTLMSPSGLIVVGMAGAGAAALDGAGLLPDPGEALAALGENAHALATPEAVMLLRSLVSAGDEIVGIAGIAGASVGDGRVPSELAGGVAVIGAAMVGAGAVKVQGVEREQCVAAPQSIADLTASIPDTDEAGTHASITEYAREDGSRVYLVSIAGTSTPEFGGDSAMDNLSNLAAYANLDQQSLGAVRDAMDQAGIEAGDQVVFAGYSQGALVATQLASSGEWDTQSVVLAGTPIHGNNVGGDVPVAQLEHDGDLITGLQGWVAPAAGEVTVIRRNPYPEGVTAEDGVLAPHGLDGYRETAELYDLEQDAHVVQQREEVTSPFNGASVVTTTDFRFTRS